MANKLPFSDLVNEMKGKETTNGWDMLVSYNVQQINDLLKVRAEKLPGVLNIGKIVTQYQDPFADDDEEDEATVAMVFELKLSTPTLQFNDGQGQVTLHFPMEGTTKKGDSSPKAIKPGHSLQIVTNLTNVSGTLTDTANPHLADFTPDSNATKTPSKHVVILDPGLTKAQGICIDFSSIKPGTLTVLDPKGKESRLANTIKTELTNHFMETGGLRYYIAGISNSYQSQQGSEFLKPSAFCFSVIPAADAGQGTLCMWIDVKDGGGNGDRPTGPTSLTFHPDKQDVHPIPEGSTASIIFSYRLMAKWLKKSFENLKCRDFNVVQKDGGGLKFELKLPGGHVKAFPGSTETKFMGWDNFPPVGFDMDSIITTVDFDPHVSEKPATMKFSLSKTTDWSYTVYCDGPPGSIRHEGRVYHQFEFVDSATWKGSDDITKYPNIINLKFIHQENFTVTGTTENYSWGQRVWGGKENEVPAVYKSITVKVPQMNLDLPGIDYFLTTNLLLPGARLFKAKDPQRNLATPRDLILLGDIASPQDIWK
ncbi:hypothetical protein TWF694_001418 [Orbilia ellipsospora]|uniref:Uncharacterized protein n=1 Tax=Orbilia ellipsospora TaxID=2528407 RepID=A0AAV9XRQ9_9PEZI